MTPQWRAVAVGLVWLALAFPRQTWAQPSASGNGAPPAFCRAPEALNLFALTVRHVLRGQRLAGEWPVFQVPCDALSSVADAAPRSVLVVDRAFASDQDVLSYGFTPLPFMPPSGAAPQPNDPFARLGRWILQPSLAAVPSVWTRGLVYIVGSTLAMSEIVTTLRPADRVAIAGQVIDAVDAIHGAGLAHLCLAPSRVKFSTTKGAAAIVLGLGVRLVIDGAEVTREPDLLALADLIRRVGVSLPARRYNSASAVREAVSEIA